MRAVLTGSLVGIAGTVPWALESDRLASTYFVTVAITRYSPARVTGVTLGLSAAGAALGGVAGATALGVALLVSDGLGVLKDLGILLIPGVIGAMLGAVCAPLAGWLLLRRVPLGRAFGGLTLGTIVGGLIGWFVPFSFNVFVQPIVTAAAGFLAAAVLLRIKHSRSDRLLEAASHDDTP